MTDSNSDPVEKVCKAMTRYHPNGGDDWGYVEDNDGPYVEPEDHTQYVSYEKAYDAAKRMNARAAIAAVLDDLMEPTEATLRAVDAAAMDKWPNAKRMAYAMHKAIVTAKRKELGL